MSSSAGWRSAGRGRSTCGAAGRPRATGRGRRPRSTSPTPTLDSPLGPLTVTSRDGASFASRYPGERLDRVTCRARVASRRGSSARRSGPTRSVASSTTTSRVAGAPSSCRSTGVSSAASPSRRAACHRAYPVRGVASYGAVAAEAGSPRAARAAGNALTTTRSRSSCRATGSCPADHRLGGYGGGTERKRYLLRLEGALD